jgi:hypothetical protein
VVAVPRTPPKSRREKRALGELWIAGSDGTCLFVMPKGKDWSAIEEAVTT